MDHSTDSEWAAWIRIQAHALRFMTTGRTSAAHAAVSSFLGFQPATDLRADALAFRAVISERLGEMEAAKFDLQSAQSLGPPSSYRRYTIELSLGDLCEKTGNPDEAFSWYLNALETAAEDPTTSGGSALASLLAMKQTSSLNPSQRELCLKIVRQAWSLFQLPNEPDLMDLPETAKILVEASSRPLPPTGVKDS